MNLWKQFTKTILLPIARQIILVIFAMGIAAIVLALTGYKPIAVFEGLGRGVTSDIGGTVRWTIPLIFCGLAIAVGFRAGVFNLGVDGGLMLGSIAATAAGLYIAPNFPGWIGLLLAFIAAIVVGIIWALIPGFLLTQWGTDEVVTTLLMNFVAVLFTDYLVMGPMRGTGSTGTTYSTDNLAKNLWLAKILPPSSASTGLFIAIILAIILAYLMYRTTIGYEFKVVGASPLFAKYGGIRSKKIALLAFAISGAIAGIAGTIEIYGVHHRFPGEWNPGLGFDGVVVALLAQNNPIGILFSSLLFGALRNGAMNMERITDVPRAMVQIVQAVIILAVTAQFTLDFLRKKRVKKLGQEADAEKTGDPTKSTGV